MCFFFFNDTATTEIYTLSLHDALPIWVERRPARVPARPGPELEVQVAAAGVAGLADRADLLPGVDPVADLERSEEHTSELQSRQYLVCRLLLEKKKTRTTTRCLTLQLL